jgi:hypothetical protein
MCSPDGMAASKSPLLTLIYHSSAVPGSSSFDLDEILTRVSGAEP